MTHRHHGATILTVIAQMVSTATPLAGAAAVFLAVGHRRRRGDVA